MLSLTEEGNQIVSILAVYKDNYPTYNILFPFKEAYEDIPLFS